MGKEVRCKLKSALIGTEVTGYFKEKMEEERGRGTGAQQSKGSEKSECVSVSVLILTAVFASWQLLKPGVTPSQRLGNRPQPSS